MLNICILDSLPSRLRCPRNTIHINMFVSFILRAALSLLKETLLVQGLGLESDVWHVEGQQLVTFINEGMVRFVHLVSGYKVVIKRMFMAITYLPDRNAC